MTVAGNILRATIAVGLGGFLLAAAALAGEPSSGYEPEFGQDGKDVIWVPTPDAMVEKMLDMAQVTANDFVIDLGSGDGRLVIAAAMRGARGRGIEYNPDLVRYARRKAQAVGVAERVSFVEADLLDADFSDATVITMFLGQDINQQIRPKLFAMRPLTRIVSNTFDLGEWTPDETAVVRGGCENWCEAFLWIVPPRVGGTWQTSHGELVLHQDFQMLSGTLQEGGSINGVIGRLRGNHIQLVAGLDEFSGHLDEGRIAGWASSGEHWRGTRTAR